MKLLNYLVFNIFYLNDIIKNTKKTCLRFRFYKIIATILTERSGTDAGPTEVPVKILRAAPQNLLDHLKTSFSQSVFSLLLVRVGHVFTPHRLFSHWETANDNFVLLKCIKTVWYHLNSYFQYPLILFTFPSLG